MSPGDPKPTRPEGARDAGSRGTDEAEAAHMAAERPAWQRAAWAAIGLGFVGLGGLGIALPGLPTTPFLLLSAACFARSSPRLYHWLLANRHFGPLIRDYRAGRGVSWRVKAWALSMMTVFVTFAVCVPLRDKVVPSVVVVAFAAFGAYYVLRLPTRR